MIYYLIITIFAFFSFDFQFNQKKFPVWIFGVLSFVILVCFAGLRYEVGADWGSYENLYGSINGLIDVLKAREEKLFTLLILWTKEIFNNYSFFIFLLFMISFYLKFRVIRQFSPDLFFSLIIYFYTLLLIYDLNGLRQGLAIAVILLSISSILERKLVSFLLLVFVATMIHKSAIIFLPFFWLSKIKISKNALILIVLGSIISSIPIRSLIENSQLFQSLLTKDSLSHYSIYVENEHFGRDIAIFSFALFQRIFILFIFYLNYEKIKIREDIKNLLFNGYFFGIIIFLLMSFSSDLATRLSFYYKALEILIIPIIIFWQYNAFSKLILWLLFVVFALIGTYRILTIPDGGLLPYNSLL